MILRTWPHLPTRSGITPAPPRCQERPTMSVPIVSPRNPEITPSYVGSPLTFLSRGKFNLISHFPTLLFHYQPICLGIAPKRRLLALNSGVVASLGRGTFRLIQRFPRKDRLFCQKRLFFLAFDFEEHEAIPNWRGYANFPRACFNLRRDPPSNSSPSSDVRTSPLILYGWRILRDSGINDVNEHCYISTSA